MVPARSRMTAWGPVAALRSASQWPHAWDDRALGPIGTEGVAASAQHVSDGSRPREIEVRVSRRSRRP